MSLVVRLAARTLPASIRERYREQWLADVRDAAEAGLRPASIALAALSFAITYDRPLPSRPVLTAELVQRRGRFAAALALSAGLLGLSGFAGLSGTGGLTGVDGYDLVIELIGTFLFAFAAVGAIAAMAIVTRTRAINPRVRIGVWLLMLAAVAPIAHLVIDGFPLTTEDLYFPLGGLAYIPGVIATVISLRLLWTGLEPALPRRRASMRAIVMSALAVLAVGGLGFAQAAIAWAVRTPISWSWAPGVATTIDADGTMVQREIAPTQADYQQWLALKDQFEWMVNAALVAYAVVTVASVVALLIVALVLRIRPGVLASAAAAILLVAAAALLWRLDLNLATPLVAADLLFAIGRLLLVGVVLYAVGGLRYSAGVRHRHDVESGVELL